VLVSVRLTGPVFFDVDARSPFVTESPRCEWIAGRTAASSSSATPAPRRQLVVHQQGSGGQAQFSALLAGQAADTEPVRDLLSWLRDHLTDDLSVAAWPGISKS
jgi:hypothetical protein